MAALKEYEVTNERVYALAAANAAEGPLEGAMQLITNPVDTLSGIPAGFYSYGQTVVEMTEGQRSYLEDSYSDELVGFSTAKRSWAYRLGVDPYSSNPQLQKTLNRYAWLSFAGGLTVRLPMMAVSGGAGMALTVVQTADDAKRMLHDLPPEQIRIRNREKLLAMGVPEDLTERFIGHQFFSPTHQTVIVESLDSLKNAKGREKFIELAMLVDNPDETWFSTRMALLLMLYSSNGTPIAELMAPNGLLMAYTANRELVVPFYIDYGLWVPRAEKLANAIEKSVPQDRPVNRKVFYISGLTSPKLREELSSRGWEVTDGIEEQALKAYDEKKSEPGKADPTRVLPEIGS